MGAGWGVGGGGERWVWSRRKVEGSQKELGAGNRGQLGGAGIGTAGGALGRYSKGEEKGMGKGEGLLREGMEARRGGGRR